MSRILIIGIDASVTERIADGLSLADHDVRVESDASAGAAAMAEWAPALVILEPIQKTWGGDYLIRAVRRQSPGVIVLALGKQGGEAAAVLAFRLGADDHLVGPVRLLEFLARVEALLRRSVIARQQTDIGGGKTRLALASCTKPSTQRSSISVLRSRSSAR